jgi:hypothetical protein
VANTDFEVNLDFHPDTETSPGALLSIFAEELENAYGEYTEYAIGITTAPDPIENKVGVSILAGDMKVSVEIAMDPHTALSLASAIKESALALLESE